VFLGPCILKSLEYIPLVLLTALLGVLVARRVARTFPWFMAYVSFAVCADLARFIVHDRTVAYFYVYWCTDGVYALLGIAVMYEVFRNLLGNLTRLGWHRWIFFLMIAVSIIITVGRKATLPFGLHNRTIALVILVEIAVRYLQVLMFVMLMILVPLVGLRWKQYASGIALGFGVYSTIALITTTRLSVLGQVYFLSWGWISLVSYSCTVLIWIWFFSTAEKPDIPWSGTSVLSFTEIYNYRRLIRRMKR